MLPSVATLRQSLLAARQDVLEASIDGVAEGVEQLVEVSGTWYYVVCCSDQEAESNLGNLGWAMTVACL